jgi:hypothetical protein
MILTPEKTGPPPCTAAFIQTAKPIPPARRCKSVTAGSVWTSVRPARILAVTANTGLSASYGSFARKATNGIYWKIE